MMEEELAAVAHELKRLRVEGVDSIYLSDATLLQLNAIIDRLPKRSSNRGRGDSAVALDLNDEPLPVLPVGNVSKASSSKSAGKTVEIKIPTPPVVTLEGESKQEQWDALKSRVLADAFCLSQLKPGKQLVFGVGNLDVDIFFCGEAPGAEEEMQAEPFVGPAGQLLTKIIGAMGFKRDQVYISNIMNFRPPMPSDYGNRPPSLAEMNYCLPYLQAQLAIVKPKVIVALGKTAVDGLLGPDSKRKMGAIRGQWFEFQGIPLIPTFHPSYILRKNNNETKRQVWEDLLKVMEKLEMPVSEKQRGYFL